MNLKDKIIISGLTDQGRVRDHNEDSIGMEAELGLLVLADGMGGHKGGEVASALAMDTILNQLKKSLVGIKAGEIDHKTGYSLESMAIEQAIKRSQQGYLPGIKKQCSIRRHGHNRRCPVVL